MDQKQQKSGISAWQATEFVWDVLLSVALPTTLCALGGRWVDTHWGWTPWGTILGLILAVTVSGTLVYRQAKRYTHLH